MKKIRKKEINRYYEEGWCYYRPEDYVTEVLTEGHLEQKLERLTKIVPLLIGLMVEKGMISTTEEFMRLMSYYDAVELVDEEMEGKEDG